MNLRKKRPVVLLLVVAGMVGAITLLSIGLVAFTSIREESAHKKCALNLRLMDMAVREVAIHSDPAWDQAGTGRAFFALQSRWPKPPRRPFDLACPVRNVSDGTIDYRGPARSLRSLSNTDPVFADRPGNHGPEGGGNVLLRNGRIYSLRGDDSLWVKAAETTSD